MPELILQVALFLLGAITEHDSKGQVTQIIMYSDINKTVECKQP